MDIDIVVCCGKLVLLQWKEPKAKNQNCAAWHRVVAAANPNVGRRHLARTLTMAFMAYLVFL